jgi:hypothetical protein
MGWFRMDMMHTKLRMMRMMFWNILQAASFDQGQVGGPAVQHQVYGVAQDGHDAHQTEVENEAYKM